MERFSTLYYDLCNLNSKELLKIDQVCTFVTSEVFQTSKTDDILLTALQENVATHATDVTSEFSHQMEAIYGYVSQKKS